MKIAIVCHDAGGAEQISSWLIENNQLFSYLFVIQGPAIKIFNKKGISGRNVSLYDAIKISDLVLCGTSWQSDLEINAIILSNKLKKKVISFIDHWVNYRERYIMDDNIFLPDEIWVSDQFAFERAKLIFHDIPVILQDNYYLMYEKKRYSNMSISYKESIISNSNNVLYIGEPIAAHANKKLFMNELGYDEYTAFDYFMGNRHKIASSIEKIIIRPHPSQKASDYEWVYNKYNKNSIIISNEIELVNDLINVDYVVGCESMAMVIALYVGKDVYSSIPPQGRKCVLPQSDIKFFY